MFLNIVFNISINRENLPETNINKKTKLPMILNVFLKSLKIIFIRNL